MRSKSWLLSALIVVSIALSACGSSDKPPTTDDSNVWTWVSGANIVNQTGTYGTKGTADAANIPGARNGSVSWVDSNGDLWLFGGYGYDSVGGIGDLNDLWKFDGSNWTWVSGASTANQTGTYGTKGVPDAANVPSGRAEAVCWIDSSGDLWLFGGFGYDSAGALGELNDLWKFDGTSWTWISGATTEDQSGVYGTKGEAAGTNVPGARWLAVSWIDSSNDLFLFGGYGYDSTGGYGYLNDLWKFDGSNWTWVSGASTANQTGTYGTKGSADPTGVPGARLDAVSWIDSSNHLWLFGGYGHDSAGAVRYLNDLWKFDGSNWTWVSGSNTVDQSGTYGAKGSAHPANVSGARTGAVSWIDSSNNLWLFGGYGHDSAGAVRYLNDLWKFDGSNWTWVSGSNTADQSGTYGAKGSGEPADEPGARWLATSWVNGNGDLWLFGGEGRDSAGTVGRLNDLWRYQP